MNDFPRNGPSGWYSNAWMSRADQSLTSSNPNTRASKSSIAVGSPRRLPVPTTNPSSNSMSSCVLGCHSTPAARRHVPRGPDDVRSRHDDGARPAVVADGHVPPVREQRFTLRPEEPAEVRRVVDARVHVDVVAYGDGQLQLQLVAPHDEVGVDRGARHRADDLAHVAPRLAAAGEEVVEARLREDRRRCADVGARREREQIERVIADRHIGARSGSRSTTDAERQVRGREVRVGRDPGCDRHDCSGGLVSGLRGFRAGPARPRSTGTAP